MPTPLPLFTAAAAGGTVLLITQKADWTKNLAIQVFAAILGTQVVIWAIYCMFIYPFFFSPYLDLPKPKGGNWILGHTMRIIRDGLGTTSRKW